ncbi:MULTISPECIES: S1 family peptidase [Mycolicibacter]|uniref:S1 family peptidase n=2 Tax=Mycolicibacter TaxID=1073531 RepID=A0ABU5XME0_9MYCO|nr:MULTISPECIES: S1 family peptidase [unclassified Mycolicibacter]MEB3022917.1 S1 family peptidase [Mycolicibacter sp. MYC098]MEB3034988.1 S1 family peptidase [Mycolicibacter sp. MYC340]
MRTLKTAAAAIAGALMLVTAPTTSASPPLPPTRDIAPGIAIVTTNAAADDGGTCTAGWLVHTSEGRPGFLTAGHCNRGGDAWYSDADGNYQSIGRFTRTVHGASAEDSDIALVELTGSTPSESAIIDIRPVTGAASAYRVAVGDTLCHYGMTTRLQCGEVSYVDASGVVFSAPSAGGDSGGPVYYRNADGTATAVGIAIRSNEQGTVAELISPWLAKWGLTLDKTRTNPVPLPARYRGGR